MKISLKKTVLFSALLMCFSAFTFAEETENKQTETLYVDIDYALESALRTHSSIRESKIQLEQSQRKYSNRWNNFLPSVTAAASASGNGSLTDSASGSGTVSANITASAAFNLGLSKKIEELKLSYESSERDYESTIREIECEIRKSFYSILYLKEQVKISSESLEAYRNQYEQTKAKKERGLVPELDLLTSQVNYEAAKITLKNAEKSYVNALLEFLNETGIQVEENQKVELTGSLDDSETLLDFDYSALDVDFEIENCASVQSLKESLEQTKLSREQLYLTTYFPSLTLSAGVNPYSYSWNWNTSSGADSGSWSISAGLSFSLDNYIPGSSADESLKEMDESIQTLELQLEDTKKSLKTSLFEMINEIQIAQETLENSRLNVELAKKSFEMAQEAYKNGTKDLSSLQTIQNSYSNAELQFRNQQLTLISSILELKNLLGK